MHRGGVTAVRGATLAVSTLVLGTAAHGEAGGAVGPPSPSVLLVTAAVGVLAAALGRRSSGPFATAAVLGAGQVAVHLSMPADPGTGMGGTGGMASMLSPSMLAAHLLVTAVLAAAVVGADRGLRASVAGLLVAIGARLARVVAALASSRVPDRAAAVPRVPAGRPAVLDAGVQLARVHPRRGPPVVVA